MEVEAGGDDGNDDDGDDDDDDGHPPGLQLCRSGRLHRGVGAPEPCCVEPSFTL